MSSGYSEDDDGAEIDIHTFLEESKAALSEPEYGSYIPHPRRSFISHINQWAENSHTAAIVVRCAAFSMSFSFTVLLSLLAIVAVIKRNWYCLVVCVLQIFALGSVAYISWRQWLKDIREEKEFDHQEY